MATIYVGNLTCNAEFQIRRWLPVKAQFHFDPALLIGIIELPDLSTAQELARQLDGYTLDGQAITAVERTRLETVLTAARSPRSNPTVAALATRLELSERETQACLIRLVSLLGITAVLQAADLAHDQASFFNYLLGSLHPVVRHALRCGSLRQAESLRHSRTPKQVCSTPVLDPVEIEAHRRQEICRQARQKLNLLQHEGITDGLTLVRARERLREAERDLAAFWERFDRAPVQPASDASRRAKRVSVSDN